MAAPVELREITKDSLRAVLDLAVAPEQEQFVASTHARSPKLTSSRTRGFAPSTPVMLPFVMAYRDPPKTFWVWRFMIDAAQQGKGYGRSATGAARRRGTQGRRRRGEAQLPPR